MSQQNLKQRSDLHLARKIWHLAGVIFIVFVYHRVDRPTALQLITLASFLFVANDILRQHIPPLNRALVTLFQPVMREHERNALAGTTYLLLGVLFVVLLFPKPIVTLALLFLAVADPLASYVGILYGKDKIVGHKSLQGSLAAFAACSVISAVFFSTQGIMTERLLIVSLIAGLIGALSELVPLGKLDDNFTFPVASSTFLWMLFYVFGGF